jgi:spermidine/putrescine-binding protein
MTMTRLRLRFALAVGILLVAAVLLGCAKSGDQGTGGAGKLNIYIWTEYLPQSVIEQFSERTGIEVNFDLYDSNEALLEKLQSGVADYDIVVPSDYMVKILIAEGLIQTIDHGRLKNMGNLDSRFLNKAFDPGNQHCLPYFWGTTGFGYDKAAAGGPVDSWAALFDPKHRGRILMLDDMREAFAAALKYQGHSLNSTDPEILRQAAELLKQQKPLVKTYNSSDFANILAAGDVDFSHGYNGEIAEVVAEDPDRLAYVVPKEGATVWMDSVCIPAKSRNVEAAYAFLDFIMEPEVNAAIVNDVHYASANMRARQFIEPEILGDAAIYPADDVISRCEFIEDIGETTTVLDQYWTEVKAQ